MRGSVGGYTPEANEGRKRTVDSRHGEEPEFARRTASVQEMMMGEDGLRESSLGTSA